MPFNLTNIHPLIIHFPIALLSTGFIFDFFSTIFKREDLNNAGFWCMLIGIIFCLLSNFTGLMIFLTGASYLDLPQFNHAIIAWAITIVLSILFWIRIKFDIDLRYSKIKMWIFLGIYFLIVSILFYGSHLGAQAAGRI